MLVLVAAARCDVVVSRCRYVRVFVYAVIVEQFKCVTRTKTLRDGLWCVRLRSVSLLTVHMRAIRVCVCVRLCI